jgi:integrase
MIVSLLAYSGIRPGELRALRWRDIGENTLLVERAAAPDGTIKATKSRRRRPVRLLRQLTQDLREWRFACGRPDEDTLIIPTTKGDPWTKTDWENWCNRQWGPACQRAGLETTPRPYDLRQLRLAATGRRATASLRRGAARTQPRRPARNLRPFVRRVRRPPTG